MSKLFDCLVAISDRAGVKWSVGDIVAIRPHPHMFGRKECCDYRVVTIELPDGYTFEKARAEFTGAVYDNGLLREDFEIIHKDDYDKLGLIPVEEAHKYVIRTSDGVIIPRPAMVMKNKVRIDFDQLLKLVPDIDNSKWLHVGKVYQPFMKRSVVIEEARKWKAKEFIEGNLLYDPEKEIDCGSKPESVPVVKLSKGKTPIVCKRTGKKIVK